MTINEIQNEIIEEFKDFHDWMDKYSLLIEYGNNLNNYDENQRIDQNLIEGCQSRVWIYAWLEDGKICYMADSDAIIVKGIIALLLKVFNNRTPDEILETDLFFIDKIGLKEHLSPTRSNGMVSMIKQLKMYALAFKHKSEN